MKWMRYFPSERDKAAGWLLNFKTVLALHAAALKLDPERVVEITTFVNSMIDCHNDIVANRKKYESSRDGFKQKCKLFFNQQGGLGSFIEEIKQKPEYTAGIGAELGIVGHFIPIDYQDYIPQLKAIVRGSENIELRFKRHYSDAVAIYCKRGAEEEFALLDKVYKSPYYDIRRNLQPGVPEKRFYKIVLIVDQREVSRESNIVEVKAWNPE